MNEEAQAKEEEGEQEEAKEAEAKEASKPLNYDKLVWELASDRRAHATDRLKTEAELAQEEKEKLEKAERHRKRRMAGEDSDTEDEQESTAAKKRRKGQAPQGDDIEDDFVLDDALVDPTGFGAGLKEDMATSSEEEESDEESDEDEEESDESEASDLEEDEDEEAVSHREDDADEQDVSDEETSKHAGSRMAVQREIPYTFPAPENHKAFLRLVRDYNADEQQVVVKRMRAIFHISLGAGNREILEQLLVILLDHVLYCGSMKRPHTAVVDRLFPHIHALASQFPEVATEHTRKILLEWQSTMVASMTQDDTAPPAFPSTRELLFLLVVMRLFPTSDKLHPVITPAFLYIGQCLGQMPVRTDRDALSGLFLCQLYIESQSISKRMMPEVFNYLYRLLAGLAPQPSALPGYFPDAVALPATWSFGDGDAASVEPTALPLSYLAPKQRRSTAAEPASMQLKVSAFYLILRLVQQLTELATGSPAFPELFRPAMDLLQPFTSRTWSDTVATRLTAVKAQLERMVKLNGQTRKPLQLQRHRPVAIASHQPKFEENYSVDKHYDPDRDRAEVQRLRALHRKERKGAMRELRRDNQFIATERAREQKEKDEAYKRKIRHITGLLTDEQGEKNKLERKARK
ncbi:nucleolar protein 14 [Syncephalis pseudoplumigaleata]|uniref:Nucleolar protein 14 n=1 Tax=Syncephalis pseudoplumigaleata TaxID=1712513 RepID=A0A4P9Z138_9FUNG|nr:nucleolar protein 14 [Syncephalis pseudoplumigaleata]|eukprot:RKP25632.1 nucleolar protein 14 [Syncephalis pseudoplumigaleata]